MMILKIGSIDIPLLAALDIEQTYDPIGGETVLRTIGGTGIKQTTWQKLRTSISGSGWIPAGLASLDTTAQQVIGCIVPRAVPCVFATRQATLPAARRSDSGHIPWGLAIMADNAVVVTTASLAGNVATVASVAGAVAYQALYLPSLTCWLTRRVSDSGNRSDASYRWEIEAEEV
jgi:hypothetical protein